MEERAPVVIGLTTYRQRAQTGVWDVDAALLPGVYVDAVTRAGGIPVLLPPLDPSAAEAVLDRIDGLLVSGGRDVDPARYGATPHAETDQPALDRDAWEDALLERAIARDLPFLAICRGLQVLNVTRGGTLLQHLPDVVGDDRYRIGGGVFARNEVAVEQGSTLARVLDGDPAVDVASYHHQAVDTVGEGLRVSARSGDGIVQALELEGARYGVAVQWHPEEDAEDDVRLFAGLVEAARAARLEAAS
ncbi:MAG: gamma-glutamyl-gamma-aminobutyrate hydrolase family protein [Actinomycetales bacterium]|nr:gamma-glutamyl-gamma-aminobutyrate hydrolase family protein [Actinomycetales bacterium]